VVQHLLQAGESGFAPWLHERHLALGIGVVADRMGQLLQHDDDADRGQHSLDDGRGKEVAEHAGPQQAKTHLQQPGQEHGEQEGLEAAEHPDGVEHDDRESGRRSGNAERRAAGGPHDDAADDPREQTGVERRPAGERDAQAQRQSDEEDDDAGREVLANVREQLHGSDGSETIAATPRM
jgi:hypothetical protein